MATTTLTPIRDGAWVARHLLTPAEQVRLREAGLAQGMVPAAKDDRLRACARAEVHDEELAHRLWQRLQKLVPPTVVVDADGAEISAEDVRDAELLATLTDDQVEEILAPLRLAMESKSPKVIRAALAAPSRSGARPAATRRPDRRRRPRARCCAACCVASPGAAPRSAAAAAAAPRPRSLTPPVRRRPRSSTAAARASASSSFRSRCCA